MSLYRFDIPTLEQAIEFLAYRKRWSIYADTGYHDAVACQRVVTLAKESAAERGEIAGQPSNEEMLMPQEREAPAMGSFFKFMELGQSVAGRIADYRVHDKNGPFVKFAPVLIADKNGEVARRYQTCAVGLSTDLKLKIRESDKGKFFVITFREKEPTTKGSPTKRFRVLELSGEEMRELAEKADNTHRDEPYTVSSRNMNTDIDDYDPTEDGNEPF